MNMQSNFTLLIITVRRGFIVALRAARACRVGVTVAVLSACSPYMFSDNVQTFSTEMGSIDVSYQVSKQKILAERHLGNRIIWIRDKPVLLPGPGCDPRATGPVSCDLIVKGDVTAIPIADTPSAQKAALVVDICEGPADPGLTPTIETIRVLTPLQRGGLLKSLDNYTAALADITKAQDRADFDNATSKVSAALGGLVQSAAIASGTAAAAAPVVGTLAKASSNAALWLVGQAHDYQRLQQMRIATGAACRPIHALAIALEFILEEQRGEYLDQLRNLLVLNIQAANIARVSPRVTDQAYGTALDNAEAAADAFQTVRTTNPRATAQTLSDAHDALVVAVRNNNGEFTSFIASLQAFSQQAKDLEAAAKATATPATNKII